MPTDPPPKKGKKRKLPQKGGASEAKKKNKNGLFKPNGQKSNNKSTESLNSIFARVAQRRRKEITLLEPALVRGFLMDVRELTGTELPSLVAAKSSTSSAGINTNQAALEVRKLLSSEYKLMCNEDVSPDKRRKSWETVNEIFRLIDTLLGQDVEEEDGDSESNEQNIQNKTSASASESASTTKTPSAPAPAPINGTKTAIKVPDPPGQDSTKARGQIAASSNRKGTPSAPKATTTTTSLATSSQKSSKPATATTSKSVPTTEQNGSKSNIQSKALPPKKAPVRTVASLSSASAMTMAAALDSNNPVAVDKNRNNNKNPPPTSKSVPQGAPAPYQKQSLTTQQHKNEKLQKPQQKHKKVAKNPTIRDQNNTGNASSISNKKKSAPSTTVSSSSAVPSTTQLAVAAASSSQSTTASISIQAKKIAVTSIPELKENPIDTKATQSIKLTQDPKTPQSLTMYGNFVQTRPQVSLQFQRFEPTKNMIENFNNRLEKWDPHWVVEKNFCVGVTSPVTKSTYNLQFAYHLKTAASFGVQDLVKFAGPRIRQVPATTAPRDMEYRVLIRMLPLYLSKQKNGGKHRADVHLWPKGTYLQIKLPNGHSLPTPLVLHQRKQQSHATEKWLGICKCLDITSFVHKTFSSTQNSLKAASSDSFVQLGCYDQELYMFSLALCKYKSPQTIHRTLLQSTLLPRVGLDEMQQRAKKLMETNEVILDSDSEDETDNIKTNTEQKAIRFSIRDPFTMGLLKTPVRGRNCLHFSCFDLCNFLELNKSAGGQRWKCGYCEDFLSFEDLEHCALTEKAAQQFGNQITNLQHMVEFKEDGSMSLCKPVRSHQERARAQKMAARSHTTSNKVSKEVVELLDSDSD